MKPSYSTFEAKKSSGFIELPPTGAYEAEILNVRFLEANGTDVLRDVIEVMVDITEGEYKGRYREVFEDQKDRFDNVKYRGIFRLTPPTDNDEDWRRRAFEGNLWCVEQSNPGYHWDWDEKKLKGKKVGISVRKKLYTSGGKDRETYEIGKFETIDDVREGKCRPMRDRDTRTNKTEDSTDGSNFTDVSGGVEVPWGN